MTRPSKHKPARPRIDARAFPSLSEFARAYLHEDVLAEHGSAVGAATAFRDEASDTEVAKLAAEIRRLVSGAHAWPETEVGTVFTRLFQSAWTPTAVSDLEDLADVLDVRH